MCERDIEGVSERERGSVCVKGRESVRLCVYVYVCECV